MQARNEFDRSTRPLFHRLLCASRGHVSSQASRYRTRNEQFLVIKTVPIASTLCILNDKNRTSIWIDIAYSHYDIRVLQSQNNPSTMTVDVNLRFYVTICLDADTHIASAHHMQVCLYHSRPLNWFIQHPLRKTRS